MFGASHLLHRLNVKILHSTILRKPIGRVPARSSPITYKRRAAASR
jgi:hypothetical protein